MNLLRWTAADWQAIAGCVTAGGVIYGVFLWAWRQRTTVSAWVARRRHRRLVSVLDREVTAGAAWESVLQIPEVSMEAGVAYARTATRSGHPPYTPTQGRATSEQPLDYLLAKTAEVVWEAVTTAHSELEPYLVPIRNYMTALAGKAGLSPARDFALGVLTERVRQEEDGWPDQAGGGKRGAHGTGTRHGCLLERKHDVEKAIYGVSDTCTHS